MERDISSIAGVIEFALEKEAESEGLYRILARRADSPRAGEIFTELAGDEAKHHEALSNLETVRLDNVDIKAVTDLKISDYLHDISSSSDMTYQDILVFAMKNEEKSFHLYQGLAAHSADPDMRKIFEFLAMQEAKHKLRLETEYDEFILKED